MLSRHEEKYILTYAQYAVLYQRVLQVLQPDKHGGTYTITSLYFDDPTDSALAEKLDGLKLHSKFRIRTYGCSDRLIKLERKDKQGILTKKISASVTAAQLPLLLNGEWEQLDGTARELTQQLRAGAYRPVVGVRYIRDAFFHPGSDLRVTFDRQIEAFVPDPACLVDPKLRGLPALEPGAVIMEIKYGKYLPGFVRTLLRASAPQLSFSKYALCRQTR